MKKITFTPTEEQAKFINLYGRVQGASSPQEVIAVALDRLEQEQKYALYDKLAEMLGSPKDTNRSSSPGVPAAPSSAASASDGHN